MRKLLWTAVVAVVVAAALVAWLATRGDGEERAERRAQAEPTQRAPAARAGAVSAPGAPAAEGDVAAAAAGAEPQDTRPVPTCAEALAQGFDNLPDDAAGDFKANLRAIHLRRCAEDGWPEAALRCYASTRSMTGLKLCRGKLTADQTSKLTAEIMEVMSGGPGAPAPKWQGPVPVGDPLAPPAK